MIQADHYSIRSMKDMSQFNWEFTWTFWPRYCYKAHKRMKPFSPMYRGTRIIHGPGDALVIRRWISPEAYTFEAIKGNI